MRRLAWLTFAFVTVAHWHVHLGYLRGLNTLGVPTAPAAPASTLAKGEGVRHAVVVVLDGLGFEKGIESPPLQEIASAGAVRMMRAEFPTFTYPGITAMMTGRPPLYSRTPQKQRVSLSAISRVARGPRIAHHARHRVRA